MENTYDARFYFNKLYVAITRAQEELIIIDSNNAFNLFWKLLLKKFSESEWLNEVELQSDDIINSLVEIKEGSYYKIITGSKEDEKEVAHREKKHALLKNDKELIRLAASRFIKIGDIYEYNLCKAEEFKMLDDFDRAHDYYLKIGLEGKDLASKMFWKSKKLTRFIDIIIKPSSITENIYIILSKAVTHNYIPADSLEILYNNTDELNKIIYETDWKNDIFSSLALIAKKEVELNSISKYLTIFNNLNTNNFLINLEIGHLYYRNENYSASIRIFEKIINIDLIDFYNKIYFTSKYINSENKGNIFDSIIWLGKLYDLESMKYGNLEKIILLYETNTQEVNQIENYLVLQYLSLSYLIIKYKSENSISVINRLELILKEKPETLRDFYFSILIKFKNKQIEIVNPVYNFILDRLIKVMFTINTNVEFLNSELVQLLNHGDNSLAFE
ncbi:MAG: hypothetical protein IPG79_14385 [Saprospiraceae bacterium]|nr:hypothetical protein [Saprospiraceae bacterium]